MLNPRVLPRNGSRGEVKDARSVLDPGIPGTSRSDNDTVQVTMADTAAGWPTGTLKPPVLAVTWGEQSRLSCRMDWGSGLSRMRRPVRPLRADPLPRVRQWAPPNIAFSSLSGRARGSKQSPASSTASVCPRHSSGSCQAPATTVNANYYL